MLQTRIGCALAAAALVLPLAAAAQQDDKARLREAIGASLATTLGGDSARVVVDRIASIKPQGAISRNFDLPAVVKQWFGRNTPAAAPDCRATQTRSGEPDEGHCLLEFGRREADEKGNSPAYSVLAYSKNIGIGDLLLARRPAGTVAPKPVDEKVLTDAKAYGDALKFLEAVGVPMSEVPRPPQGAPPPVRSLAIGELLEDQRSSSRMTIQKVVSLPRAFAVPDGFPWLKTPNGDILRHVIAPGKATVVLDNAGVQFASVEGWSDAQIGPVDARGAKSTSELADEITDDLWGEGVRKVGSLSILIALRKGYPNPDDPNPPLCPVCGLLLPAVQVLIAPVGPELLKQGMLAPPGVIREYDLVRASEAAARR